MTILYYDGANWNRQGVSGATAVDLYGIAGFDASNAWAAGDGGVIARWSGTSWQGTTITGSPDLKAVAFVGNPVVVGVNHSCYSATMGQTRSCASRSETLLSVWGSSNLDVWAGGLNAVILNSNNGGSTWTQVSGPTLGDVTGIWGSGPNDVYAARSADVLHRP